MLRLFTAALGAVMVLLPWASFADDWTADRLRGQVVQFVDNQWQPLKRGMVVPDDRIVRTMKTGHVTLQRGSETVDLGPDTQIQISDKAGSSKPFTTVKQYFGSVAVEADVRKVQHFGVDTPFLAAVVKGTRFTVSSDKSGSSVSVRRGHVAVENLHTHSTVTLSVGQMATVGAGKSDETEVSGSGKLPTVVDAKGNPMTGPTDDGARISVADGLLTTDVGDDGVSVSLLGINVGVSNSANLGSSARHESGGNGGGNSSHSGLLSIHLGGLHLGL